MIFSFSLQRLNLDVLAQNVKQRHRLLTTNRKALQLVPQETWLATWVSSKDEPLQRAKKLLLHGIAQREGQSGIGTEIGFLINLEG